MYTNNAHDSVAFTLIQNGKMTDYPNMACYSSYARTTAGFIAKDPNVVSQLPEEEYIQWIELCRQHGLVATEAIPFREFGSNQLYLEENCYDYSVVYATLCCYRWSTHFVKMCHDLIKDNRPISFHQKLHYYLGKTVTNWNHSFTYCALGAAGGAYGGSRNHNLDLQTSLAWKIFYNDLTADERANWVGDRTWVNDAIVAFARKCLPEMHIAKIEDVLLEKWKPLYEQGNMGTAKYGALFEKCK